MAKYLLAYVGNPGFPDSPEEQQRVMDAWNGWLGGLGSAKVDGGSPIMASSTVSPDGSVWENVPSRLGGYSMIEAANLAEAARLVQGCPHLTAGGEVEIFETVEMP